MAETARDTVYAVSTAHGRAAIAIVRVSGPNASQALGNLTGEPLPPPRMAAVRRLSNTNGDAIDQALVLWFPEPVSATGEDIAEFHLHGGLPSPG